MSLRINHNISSLNGHRQLMKNQNMMSKSLERLSSGLKINRAADGAAGLVISEQMRAQITGLGQAVSNSETAVSMVQTTEGALDEVNSLLNKARELTLHANNSGANDTNQLAADQSELDNVIQTITRISDVTQFGTKKLLDGNLNGASSLAAGISHVKVGNLANNSAISAGTASLAITGGIKEAITLKKSGATTDNFIFTTAVTGVSLGSKTVTSGVTVSLTVGTGTVTYATTGAMNATALATKLSAKLTAAGMNYAATASTGGAIKVTRSTYGSDNFTSSISFTKATKAAIAGTKEAVVATLKATSDSTSSIAAGAIFSGVSKLSGLTTAAVVKGTGTKFTTKIQTATGGVFTDTFTSTGNKTLSQVLSGLQTLVRAHNAGFSGATLTLGTGVTSGVQFKLQKGSDSALTDFTFSLDIDKKNNQTLKSQGNSLNISAGAYTTGVTSGASTNVTFAKGASLTGGAVLGTVLTGTSYLVSGNAISATISGVTVTVTGKRTLTAVATALQTAITSLGASYSNLKVVFANSGTVLSGLAGNQKLTGKLAAGFHGFFVYNTDGNSMSVSLKVDQKQGSDIAGTSAQYQAGAKTSATLDVVTTAQSRVSGVTTIAAISGRTVSSTSGGSTITSGANTLATMTTANGVTLNLKQSFATAAGVVTMTLTTGSQALGYSGFSAEITSALASGGGSTSFTLGNGAEFQVGANALQKVGLIISNSSAVELGRGASTSLTSLEDLLSNHSSALTNGKGNEALKVIDAAIDEITNQRGKLGAFQANTLESGLNSLRVSKENLTAAESTIRDVDFAEESAAFTRNQILVQASTSMLAQANQMPQNVLKLLG